MIPPMVHGISSPRKGRREERREDEKRRAPTSRALLREGSNTRNFTWR